VPHASTYAELKALSTEELVRIYDATAKSTEIGLAFLREEIVRRENAEQTAAISRMTKQMRNLTIVITVLTVINVVFTGIPLFK
jgi:hypothetical protein